MVDKYGNKPNIWLAALPRTVRNPAPRRRSFCFRYQSQVPAVSAHSSSFPIRFCLLSADESFRRGIELRKLLDREHRQSHGGEGEAVWEWVSARCHAASRVRVFPVLACRFPLVVIRVLTQVSNADGEGEVTLRLTTGGFVSVALRISRLRRVSCSMGPQRLKNGGALCQAALLKFELCI